MKSISTTTIFLIAAITAAPAVAFDTAAGRDQLEKNCTACHSTDVYTRADKRINSRPALSAQVHRCQVAQGLGWFDDEVENTAEYLNHQFYKFK
ncbi:MAG: cytochrome c [Candidatus Sedimenticola sp. (ex Thyasira tokunagai)]